MVRQATEKDLDAIASVHIQCFPDSFSSSIGKRLLKKFYFEYFSDAPELFLVCENSDGQVVGFCMGYYMEKQGQMKRFVKHNFVTLGLTCVWRLLCGDKRAWKKLLYSRKPVHYQIVNHDFDNIPVEEQGDLLSICILPEYRGNGYAQTMIQTYLDVLRNRGRSICALSVEARNGRGIHFYEKNGFVLYRKTDTDEKSDKYIADLRPDEIDKEDAAWLRG